MKNFNLFNEINVKTNFTYLSGIRVFEKTLMITPRSFSNDSYHWKQFLGDKYEKKKNSEKYLEYNRLWKEFQEFKYKVITKLGGNKIVYIDDYGFQEAEDMFYQGRKLDEVFLELQKTGPLFKIEKLYNEFDTIFNNYNHYGFYEDLK